MSDAIPSPRPQHSRSSSISKTARTNSHQRKPSNSTNHLYAIQENQKADMMDTFSPPPPTSINPTVKKPMPRGTSSWRYYLNLFHRQVDSLFDSSSSSSSSSSSLSTGPLLPQDKHTTAFGGPAKSSSRGWLSVLGRSTVVRFLVFLYVVFSIFLSLHHLWSWLTSESVDAKFGDGWIPQRTYDQDKTYSVLDDMTHGLKMSKMFTKANYDTTDSTQPFWLKASETPAIDDISLVTVITPGTWSELERLVEYWKGPISVTLHMDHTVESMNAITQQYNSNAEISKRVDIHLSESARPNLSVLLPRNAERNLARLFAQTDYVMEMPSNKVPTTDIRRTLETNKEMFDALLRAGDILVVPTFGFPEQESTLYKLPFSKARLLELVDENTMFLLDKHWKPNTGPTDLDEWKVASTLYPVKRYDFHYEPVVIESKSVQPWCAERFLDSRSACLFSSYLTGGEFWVLPDDYMVELPDTEKSTLSAFDNVIENRLYAKFYWEQCVHHARQLDALGLWKGKRSQHIRTQCSRVIQNWGKGLIGKPE